MLCDIDFLKSYNDTYGHLAGDEVLKRVARVVSENLRKGDAAYRYGGEELLIVLPEQSLQAASIVAEWLRRGVRDCHLPQYQEGATTSCRDHQPRTGRALSGREEIV